MSGPQQPGNADRVRGEHPCFGAVKNRGRLHLPVAPTCNISCNFCDRTMDSDSNRPGVTGSILRPEECPALVEEALRLSPAIRVVGIAGPGDTLASDNALEAFRLVGKRFPQLLKCMSTNGLLLAERAAEVISVGLNSLTVTVNAVDPRILAKIMDSIHYHGEAHHGEAAGEILIPNQLAGIRALKAAGTVIKVNTVLVPGVNQAHIPEVARMVAAAGADIYNIIPLIPQALMRHYPPPSCEELAEARSQAEAYIEVFRHCQHCRADAAGVPGKSDFAKQLYRQGWAPREVFSHG